MAQTECRGKFSYEVLDFPLRIGHFSEIEENERERIVKCSEK